MEYEGELVRGMTFDELYGIHHTILGETKYFLLERDRVSETERYAGIVNDQTDIFKKVLQLDAAFKDFKAKKRAGKLEAFKYRVPNWRVLFLTDTSRRAVNMRATATEATGGLGRSVFMFGTREEFTAETLLSYAWMSTQNGKPATQKLVPLAWHSSTPDLQ